MKSQLRWAEHVCTMDHDRLPKLVLFGELSSGQRGREAPIDSYKDNLKKIFTATGHAPLLTATPGGTPSTKLSPPQVSLVEDVFKTRSKGALLLVLAMLQQLKYYQTRLYPVAAASLHQTWTITTLIFFRQTQIMRLQETARVFRTGGLCYAY